MGSEGDRAVAVLSSSYCVECIGVDAAVVASNSCFVGSWLSSRDATINPECVLSSRYAAFIARFRPLSLRQSRDANPASPKATIGIVTPMPIFASADKPVPCCLPMGEPVAETAENVLDRTGSEEIDADVEMAKLGTTVTNDVSLAKLDDGVCVMRISEVRTSVALGATGDSGIAGGGSPVIEET